MATTDESLKMWHVNTLSCSVKHANADDDGETVTIDVAWALKKILQAHESTFFDHLIPFINEIIVDSEMMVDDTIEMLNSPRLVPLNRDEIDLIVRSVDDSDIEIVR